MIPTDRDRSSAAARLRSLIEGKSPMAEYPVESLFIAIGMPVNSNIDGALLGYIADLIEPAPPSVEASKKCDRDMLMALAEVLSTPEQDVDCNACPLRGWCEEARDGGSTITCFDCKLWHTADAIREAIGNPTS